MAIVLIFVPMRPSHIEAEITIPVYRIESGELVDQPIQHIKETEPSATEACNCYKYVRNRVSDLPNMLGVLPNSEPFVGSVAIEFFNGIKHVSLITSVEPNGVWVEEANYNHCKTGVRFIPFNHYSLVGFWSR